MKGQYSKAFKLLGLSTLLGLFFGLVYGYLYGDYIRFFIISFSVSYSVWLLNIAFRILCLPKIYALPRKKKIFLESAGVFVAGLAGVLIPLAILEKTMEIHFFTAKPLIVTMALFVILFGMMSGLTYSIQFSRELKDKEQATEALQALAVEAELRALRSQVNPHFLFNVLNSVNSLITQNPSLARKMIVRLSDLLRTSLESRDEAVVPIRQEVEFAHAYLEIEKIRFGDKMDYHEVIDAELENTLFPAMVLQPLLENAVKHGIAGSSERGIIKLSVSRSAERIQCIISNTVPKGSAKTSSIGEGTGLANIKQRLGLLYKNDVSFEAGYSEGGTFEVRLSLPLTAGSSHGSH